MSNYTTLGLTASATHQEVKTAFRKLAQVYHPDKVTGNAETYKKMHDAYEAILKTGHESPLTKAYHDSVNEHMDFLKSFKNAKMEAKKPEPAKAESTLVDATFDDLPKLVKADLIKICDKHKVAVPSTAKKKDIIDLIRTEIITEDRYEEIQARKQELLDELEKISQHETNILNNK